MAQLRTLAAQLEQLLPSATEALTRDQADLSCEMFILQALRDDVRASESDCPQVASRRKRSILAQVLKTSKDSQVHTFHRFCEPNLVSNPCKARGASLRNWWFYETHTATHSPKQHEQYEAT